MSELQNKTKSLKGVKIVIRDTAIIYAIFMFYQMFSGTFKVDAPQVSISIIFIFVVILLQRQQKENQAKIENRQSA